MIFDRMLSFFEKQTIPTTASTTTAGRVIDMRLNGEDVDHNLSIWIGAVGAAPSAAVTTKIQTSANGTSNWTDLASQTSNGNVLFSGKMPLGTKRFVRAVVTTGGSALSAAFVAKGGVIVGECEANAAPTLQTFAAGADGAAPVLEDVAATTVVTMH